MAAMAVAFDSHQATAAKTVPLITNLNFIISEST